MQPSQKEEETQIPKEQVKEIPKLSEYTKIKLADLLFSQSECFESLISSVDNLYNDEDFQIKTIFSRIDRDQDDSISSDEIIKFLNENNIFTVKKQDIIDHIIKKFDQNEDDKLNLNEFSEFFVKFKKHGGRNIQNRGVKVAKNERLPNKLENEASLYILSYLHFYLETDYHKRELKKQLDFSVEACYDALFQQGKYSVSNSKLDVLNEGFEQKEFHEKEGIEESDIFKFLKIDQSKNQESSNLINNLFRFLDVNNNQFVSKDELELFLAESCPQEVQKLRNVDSVYAPYASKYALYGRYADPYYLPSNYYYNPIYSFY